MRFASLNGRLSLVDDQSMVADVAAMTSGRFGPEVGAVYERWNELVEWIRSNGVTDVEKTALGDHQFASPSPAPRQVFGIGLNYSEHATESKLSVPDTPTVFTKFVSSLTGPYGEVVMPDGDVDWEVELVVVIGQRAERVDEERAWGYVAGLTVGQDISERRLQLSGPAPQFSLGKSYPGFGPVGPYLVTPDELADRDDLELGCFINGEQVQKGRTSEMVFTVPELIARLSAVTPLLPGDLIFTGTPAGVGLGRTPQRYLAEGDELVSYVKGIGEMRHRFVRKTKS